MPTRDGDPLTRPPAWLERDEAEELSESGSDPGDDYFSSGSFSPVPMQLGDGAEGDEPDGTEEAPRAAPELDDSPQVIVQLGEDPGVVAREDPDDA